MGVLEGIAQWQTDAAETYEQVGRLFGQDEAADDMQGYQDQLQDEWGADQEGHYNAPTYSGYTDNDRYGDGRNDSDGSSESTGMNPLVALGWIARHPVEIGGAVLVMMMLALLGPVFGIVENLTE